MSESKSELESKLRVAMTKKPNDGKINDSAFFNEQKDLIGVSPSCSDDEGNSFK